MMEYARADARHQAGPASSIASRVPELGRIKLATERVAKAAHNVDAFLGRFNGPQLQGESAAREGGEGYRNDLVDLFEQIDRLESLVAALTDIG